MSEEQVEAAAENTQDNEQESVPAKNTKPSEPPITFREFEVVMIKIIT